MATRDELNDRFEGALAAQDRAAALRALEDGRGCPGFHSDALVLCCDPDSPLHLTLLRHLLVWDESEADPAAEENEALRQAVLLSNLGAAELLVESGRVSMDDAIGHPLTEGVFNYQSREKYDRAVRILALLLEHFADEDPPIYRAAFTYRTLLDDYGWAYLSLREAFAEAALLTGTWAVSEADFATPLNRYHLNPELPGRRYHDALGVAIAMAYPGAAEALFARRRELCGLTEEDARAAVDVVYFGTNTPGLVDRELDSTISGRQYMQALAETLSRLVADGSFRRALAERARAETEAEAGAAPAWLGRLVRAALDRARG